jgi:ABC-2 type transport system permease protein
MNSTIRLVRTEAKLFVREPVSLLFVLGFPALVVLVLGGVFGDNDPGFGGTRPSAYYVAAYFGVVLAAVGFIMLPVHLASYRERGVFRRFEASHFPPWALPVAWIVVATMLSLLGFGVLLGTAQLAYGVPAIADVASTLVAIGLSIATFLSFGILLGLLIPSARAAQGVGMALFFPSFLLGGGGPPPAAMPTVMRAISNVLPMTQAVRAIQHPWLGMGPSTGGRLATLAAMFILSTAAWIRVAGRTGKT